jgi:hypothetical protein
MKINYLLKTLASFMLCRFLNLDPSPLIANFVLYLVGLALQLCLLLIVSKFNAVTYLVFISYFSQRHKKSYKYVAAPFLFYVGEKIESGLGRMVHLIWLFVVLILNSSYIASLTSILIVQQLSYSVKGIESLTSSNDPIGYQRGSSAENYLIDELNIHKSRLVPLDSAE